MTFHVIDAKTGKGPTSRVIDNIAKKGGLMVADIDQFFVGEDGSLGLADDCGRMTYCDPRRFKVVAEKEGKFDVLDKVRAEIIKRDKRIKAVRNDNRCFFTAQEVVNIIDSYKSESEDKE